jgi:hypothetical protein
MGNPDGGHSLPDHLTRILNFSAMYLAEFSIFGNQRCHQSFTLDQVHARQCQKKKSDTADDHFSLSLSSFGWDRCEVRSGTPTHLLEFT